MFDINKPSLTLVGIVNENETMRLCQLIREIRSTGVYAPEEIPVLKQISEVMRTHFTQYEADTIYRIAGRIKSEPVAFKPLVIKPVEQRAEKTKQWMTK